MSFVNHMAKEVNCKIVYYGPGLCGKTTNLEHMFAKLRDDVRGKMVTLATETERTLFFDFMPLDLGTIKGFKIRLHMYTVPGQVFYDASRKLVLKGADGVVFVADSQPSRAEANIESFQNLEVNLAETRQSLSDVSYVIQYNKRDLPEVMSIDQMQGDLNVIGAPYFEAAAADGTGVFETLKGLSKGVLQRLQL
jgi:hypothetical protein